MTQQELDALKALADAATPGPWRAVDSPDNPGREVDICSGATVFSEWVATLGHPMHEEVRADAAFVAAACEAVPALLAEVERLC
jgi:hypothetical protein